MNAWKSWITAMQMQLAQMALAITLVLVMMALKAVAWSAIVCYLSF